MNIKNLKNAIREVLNEKSTREIMVISPVDWGIKLSFSREARYPMMSDIAWELKRMRLKEKHPDATVLEENEYKIVLLVEKVKEKDDMKDLKMVKEREKQKGS